MAFSIISEYVYCVFCNRSGCILVILAACNESTDHITFFPVYPFPSRVRNQLKNPGIEKTVSPVPELGKYLLILSRGRVSNISTNHPILEKMSRQIGRSKL